MRLTIALVLVLWSATAAQAQDHYALEILRPLPTGTAGSGLDADNRIYRAYQGITYTIPVAAIGGEWPYTYSLTGAPTGMTIEAGPCTDIGPSCTAGTITWVNPQTTDSSISVEVCDVDNDCETATWGVTVSTTIGTDGFCFIDADDGNDSTGNGSLATPWQTVDKARDSCGARSILYFRGATATYNLDNITTFASECPVSVSFSEGSHPTQWVGYPGESPVLDIGYAGAADKPCAEMGVSATQNIWISNLRVENCQRKCFEMIRNSRYGVTVWANTFDTIGAGVDGANSAVLMWAQLYGGGGVPNTQGYYDVVMGNTFLDDGSGDIVAVKAYSWLKGLVANNSFSNFEAGELVAMKSDDSQFTLRGNRFSSVTGKAIAGNNHQVQDQTYGEILHNLIEDASTYALEFNQDGQAGAFHIYRNTFIGHVNARSVDTADGPFNFTANVIVNSGGSGGGCPARLTCTSVSDTSRLVLTDNLQGADADGIVDANGDLTGSYRTTYLGTRGYELGEVVQSVPPTAPLRLRISGEEP